MLLVLAGISKLHPVISAELFRDMHFPGYGSMPYDGSYLIPTQDLHFRHLHKSAQQVVIAGYSRVIVCRL